MGELEDAQGRSDVLRAEVATRGQRRGHGGGFVAKLGLPGGQRGLVDRPRQVGVQKPFLHRLNLGQTFLLCDPLFPLDVADVPKRHLQRHAEPVSQRIVGNSDRFQICVDCILKVVGAPPHAGMVGLWIVVRAPVVIVNANSAALQLPLDPFAGDHRPAMLAGEQSSREWHVDLLRRATHLAIENLLTHCERPLVNQWAMAPQPVFIQTEDGLGNLDAARFPLAESFDDVMAAVMALYSEAHDFQTVVVDSADWLEQLIWKEVIRRRPTTDRGRDITSIEDYGFAKG